MSRLRWPAVAKYMRTTLASRAVSRGMMAVLFLIAVAACDGNQSPAAPVEPNQSPAGNVGSESGPTLVTFAVPDSVKNPVSSTTSTSTTSTISGPSFSWMHAPTVSALVSTTTANGTAAEVAYAPELAPTSATTELTPGCDDCVLMNVPIGFTFRFYGSDYTALNISTNGFVTFGSAQIPYGGCCKGLPIPVPNAVNNMIAVAWTDWMPASSTPILYETRGTAPNRRFIVQFDLKEYGGKGRLKAQLVLYEGSNSAVVYTQELAATTSYYHPATQGIENATGTEASYLPGRVNTHFALSNDGASFGTGSSAPAPAANRAPVASVGGAYSGMEGAPVSLSLSGSDPDGDALTYTWDLGDGTTGTGSTPPATHVYDDNGSYTISLTVSDGRGGTNTATTTATIANAAPTLSTMTGPIQASAVNTAIAVSATYSDPGIRDTHVASVDWGDGSSSAASVMETNGSGTASATHGYTSAGIYTVTMTVTDKDGGVSSPQHFQYVVVYDPSAGFVTGGGWIDSPAGAYAADPALAGKATFGFNARYQNAMTIPTGNLQFHFAAGSLDFESTSGEWLVITGARAQYQGAGTINGAGSYGVLFTAIDGQTNGGHADAFRIKIWDRATGAVVYDNQMGASDDSGAATLLGGGSITIHR
ncbi:MAG TPA: PKD domain-containing protein [Gemmatimonadaceae bacterium]